MRAARFRVPALACTQVGSTQLAHFGWPISAKAEIGCTLGPDTRSAAFRFTMSNSPRMANSELELWLRFHKPAARGVGFVFTSLPLRVVGFVLTKRRFYSPFAT